jgi:hypothetical protein
MLDGKKKHSLPVGDEDTWVVSCSVSDPYILLILNIGDVLLLQIEESTKTIATVKSLQVSFN